MSKQDVLLYYVSCYDGDEQRIIEDFTNIESIRLSEIKEAIEIYKYKPVVGDDHDIPEKWISLFMDFVQDYSLKPDPFTIHQYYFNNVLLFLNGADLVHLELALGHLGNTLIEDFARHYIRNNPVLGVVLNTHDLLNFPCYQNGKNYKFLHHLLFAYPNLSIIGGAYADKTNPGLAKKTCLSLYNHRKYLIEKTIKTGGLAFVLNVFNRIIINAPFKFSSPAGISFHDHYSGDWMEASLNDMYIIPQFDKYLWHFMLYFGSTYLDDDHLETFEEKFEMEYDIDTDDDQYKWKFGQFMETLQYQAMSKFVEAVRPKLPQIGWTELLTQRLGMVASYGYYECVPILMNIGAKINLSGKILNRKTLNVITEALCGSTEDKGIKTLMEIFKRAKEKDFENEDEKISDRQMQSMLNDTTSYKILRDLVSTLLNNRFVLSQDAAARLEEITL